MIGLHINPVVSGWLIRQGLLNLFY